MSSGEDRAYLPVVPDDAMVGAVARAFPDHGVSQYARSIYSVMVSEYLRRDRRKCKAYQASDQMVCDHCKMSWDVNDPYPPDCNLDEGEE